MAPGKRSHKTLTLVEKCKILDYIDAGKSTRQAAENFNIPKSTVFEIKKNKDKIRTFISKSFQGTGRNTNTYIMLYELTFNVLFLGKRKVIRKAEHPEVEIALYNWFLQQRNAHVPISSEILRAKAKQFYEQITGKKDFLASSGWLDKFKLRHGIRFLKVCGEKLSSNVDAIIPFQKKLKSVVDEMKLSNDQVYNADESALFWRTLPDTTWVHQDEKSAPGRKISKDRLTFMPCCNAAGSHKLPLLVLGKATNPRAFKNVNFLPVVYKASTKGWMTRPLFMEWFKKSFIPEVKKFLTRINKPHKALLLVDNAPSHPSEEEVNTDSNFRIMFLPPNCTAVIQPLDQNLIQNIKVSYRKRILNYIMLHEGEGIPTLLKQYNLKDAVDNLDQSWRAITSKNIKKSWSSLCPEITELEASDDENIPLSELQKKLRPLSQEDLEELTECLKVIDPENNLNSEDITKWALGDKEIVIDLTEEELIQDALGINTENIEEAPESDENIEKVKHTDAVNAFSLAIRWTEENNLPIEDVLLLKRLKEKAFDMATSKKVQTKIDTYFKQM